MDFSDPLSYRCHACGAKRGQPCFTYQGNKPTAPHKIRKIHARDAADRDARLKKEGIR